MLTSRNYVFLLLVTVAAVIGPAAGLNLLLAYTDIRFDKNALASAWQEARHGVTYAPPISRNRPFKTLRLNDRIPDVDTLIFGSSTVMSIREDIFSPPRHAYNFGQSGNSLSAMIGEADYALEHWGGSLKLLVIPLDWALGFVFQPGAPDPVDLSRAGARAAAQQESSGLAARVADAASAPRIYELARVLRTVAAAPDPGRAFTQYFREPAGDEYRCPDGSLARDFDTVFRGLCVGFRYDGSATFADQKRITPDRWPAAVLAAGAASSQYAGALRATGGRPNQALLLRLAELARHASVQGGRVVLLLPPLLPGVEARLLASEHSGAALHRTKDELTGWATSNGLTLLDAGASERFGCNAVEFIDAHHALYECYRKVFEHFAPVMPAAGARGAS
jgi:hypothetical protein